MTTDLPLPGHHATGPWPVADGRRAGDDGQHLTESRRHLLQAPYEPVNETAGVRPTANTWQQIPSESGRHSPLARDGMMSSELGRAGHAKLPSSRRSALSRSLDCGVVTDKRRRGLIRVRVSPCRAARCLLHPSQCSVATGWRLTSRGRRAAPYLILDRLAAIVATGPDSGPPVRVTRKHLRAL